MCKKLDAISKINVFSYLQKPNTYTEMYLKKNDVYVSMSLAESNGRNTMFGTAILALQVGDKVRHKVAICSNLFLNSNVIFSVDMLLFYLSMIYT